MRRSTARLSAVPCRTRGRTLRGFGAIAAVIAVAAASAVPGPAAAAAGGFHTEPISVATGGAQAGDRSLSSAISADRRFVAFDSPAPNLVAGDTNGFIDTFVRDTRAGRTERVSVSSAGTQADGDNYGSSITADGRYVVFDSYATNLVPGADAGNVLIHDRQTGRTSLVSVSHQGGGASTGGGSHWGTVSAPGRYVAFASWESTIVPGDTNGVLYIFVRDLVAGTTTRASMASSGAQSVERSGAPSVSADGRYVAFTSEDVTLVAGDTNGGADVFLRDLRAGTTRRVSETRTGAVGNSSSSDGQLTPDGRYIVFSSAASNLVADDTDEIWDVFVQDLRTHRSTLVSRASSGAQGEADSSNGRITPDARHVVYNSSATNLVPGDTNDELDVFVTDRR